MISKIDSSRPNTSFGNFIVPNASKYKFLDYTRMAGSETIKRGYKQLRTMLGNCKYYDLVYDARDNSIYVAKRDISRSKIIKVFTESPRGITGFNHFGVVRFPGRKILAKIFQPRKFLPLNINEGADEVLRLEKKAVMKQKAYAALNPNSPVKDLHF